MKKILLSFLLVGTLGFTFTSCEKKEPIGPGGEEGEGNETVDPEISDEEWTIMDETYVHFAFLSLWNKEAGIEIPETYPEVRDFTKNYDDADKVLNALIAKTPKIGPNGTPVDRFSFIDRAGQVGEEIGEGKHRSLGLSMQYFRMSRTSNEVGLFIRLVQKNSPSEEAGLTRGMQILRIDGETLNLTAGANNRVEGNTAIVNKLFTGEVNTLSITDWTKETPENKTIDIPSGGPWNIDPITVSNVFEIKDTGKKVGYLAYSTFVSVLNIEEDAENESTNISPNSYHNDLTGLFTEFASAGIDELVVDFRYNGGGSTNAAELLTNLIVPTGNNGKKMYQYIMNDYQSSAGEIPPTQIAKTNSLNLQRVYFLVTTASASASELVINNLKPYMDVQIISTDDLGTYGKPVGSYGVEIKDNGKVLATTYITSLKLVNARGEGDYFSGLIGQKSDSHDNINYQLGDPEETMFYDALYHIQNGSYRATPSSSQARIMRGNRSIPVPAAIDVQIDKNIQGLYNLEYKPVLKLDK